MSKSYIRDLIDALEKAYPPSIVDAFTNTRREKQEWGAGIHPQYVWPKPEPRQIRAFPDPREPRFILVRDFSDLSQSANGIVFYGGGPPQNISPENALRLLIDDHIRPNETHAVGRTDARTITNIDRETRTITYDHADRDYPDAANPKQIRAFDRVRVP